LRALEDELIALQHPHGRVYETNPDRKEELIALQYANGRVYETTLDRTLTPGEQFDMYGRRWIAMPPKTSAKTSKLSKFRTLCVPADSAYV
jgi:hypothetical protein